MRAIKGRRLRIPIRLVDGVWECALGGAIPVAPGTEAELVVDRSAITDKTFLNVMDNPTRHRVLGEGAVLRVCLTIKPDRRPSEALNRCLIPYAQVEGAIATQFLDTWDPSTLCFVEVVLSKPDETRQRSFDLSDGGLWLVTQGVVTTSIISTTIIMPEPIGEGPAVSLNHALTILSEVYEPWRLSHTGNVYSRVLYEATNRRWYPLEVLRSATLELQEQAIAGELWDEFMRKMIAIRDRPKRK